MIYLRSALTLALCLTVGAFSPSTLPKHAAKTSGHERTSTSSTVSVWSEPKKKGGLEAGVRSKLISESIAPWRTIRLFLYGALGSGAFIGGLINISGAVAGSNSPNFNLNTEVSSLYHATLAENSRNV